MNGLWLFHEVCQSWYAFNKVEKYLVVPDWVSEVGLVLSRLQTDFYGLIWGLSADLHANVENSIRYVSQL